jgi:hypothetical protein
VFSSLKEPIRVSGDIAANCAGALQLIREARKERLQGFKPSGEKPMSMVALWYATAMLHGIDHRVALDKDYLTKVIRQHAGRAETRDAGANHGGTIASLYGPLISVCLFESRKA